MKAKRILSALLSVLMAGNLAVQSIPAGAISLREPVQQAEEQTLLTMPSGSILFEAEEDTAETSAETTPEETEPATEETGGNTVSDACGPGTIWTLDLDTHILTISGSGEIRDLTYKSDGWLSYNSLVEEIVIQPGITASTAVLRDCQNARRITMPLIYAEKDGISAFSGLFGNKFPAGLTSVTLTDCTELPDAYFKNCTGLTEIVLPATVTTIGENAFSGCTALATFAIPEATTSIGSRAFNNCKAMTEITFPDQLTEIGSYAFFGCAGLTALQLPETLTKIGVAAFQKCTGLTELTIPQHVTELGEDVFDDDTALTSLTLPFAGNMTSADGSLNENASLAAFFDGSVPDTLTSLTITGGTFIPDNYLNGRKHLTSVTLMPGIEIIGKNAFINCSGLTALTIPDTVTVIGESAFQNCTGLTSMTIPASVKTLDANAFKQCTGLTSVKFQNGLETIGGSAFNGCTGLEAIALPDSLCSIGSNAFYDCPLTELTIPDNVTSLGTSLLKTTAPITTVKMPAYSYGNGFKTILFGVGNNPPETLTTVVITSGTELPEDFFYYCQTLTSVTLPETLTTIDNKAFRYCTALSEIVIPDSVYAIGADAFSNTAWYDAQDNGIVYAGKVVIGMKGSAADSDLFIAGGTTGIAESAFYRTSITSVTFPDSLLCIGPKAFYSCTALTAVTLPEAVHTIGDSAFSACSKLAEVNVPDSVTNVGTDVFYGTKWINNQSDGPVYVGRTFYGYKGTMEHNTKLVLREDCTAISNNALSGYADLTEIVLPEGLVKIGNNAFKNCTGLTEITLPESLTSMGSYAFQGCTGLKSITVPSGVTVIPLRAFSGCTALTSVSLPAGLTKIEEYAFFDCAGVKDLTIPGMIKSCWGDAFSYSSSQKDYLSETLTLRIADGSTTADRSITRYFTSY